MRKCVNECNELGLSKTHFVIHAPTEKIAAFLTLSTGSISFYKQFGPRKNEKKHKKEPFDHFPLVCIDQIAVSKSFQREGLGTEIVYQWIDIVRDEITPKFGSRFIYCESFDNKSNKKFFKNCGFDIIPEKWTEKTIYRKRSYLNKLFPVVKRILSLFPNSVYIS